MSIGRGPRKPLRPKKAWERKRKPSAIRPRKPIKSRNPERQKREKQRAYGGQSRKDWIAAMPCLIGCAPPSVNAHTRHPSSGMGYKGDACANVPLCAMHETEKHAHGEDTFNEKYRRDLLGRTLAEWASTIEDAWQLRSGEVAA